MKVKNMIGNGGRAVPNQFLIEDDENRTDYFQSYKTIIAKKVYRGDYTIAITLDHDWAYSSTTGKYRNQFLGETRKETEAKIKDGTYTVANLN